MIKKIALLASFVAIVITLFTSSVTIQAYAQSLVNTINGKGTGGTVCATVPLPPKPTQIQFGATQYVVNPATGQKAVTGFFLITSPGTSKFGSIKGLTRGTTPTTSSTFTLTGTETVNTLCPGDRIPTTITINGICDGLNTLIKYSALNKQSGMYNGIVSCR
jgi:hypothetical protein